MTLPHRRHLANSRMMFHVKHRQSISEFRGVCAVLQAQERSAPNATLCHPEATTMPHLTQVRAQVHHREHKIGVMFHVKHDAAQGRSMKNYFAAVITV